MATEKTETTLAVEAAKYLIQLYSTTKYSCNRLKLQKLIIIAHLVLLLNGEKGLLDEGDITYSPTGLGVESISKKFYVFGFNNTADDVDERIPNTEVSIRDNDTFSPDFQYDPSVVTKEIREILNKVFLEFGAYTCFSLGYISLNIGLYDEQKCSINTDLCLANLKLKYNGDGDDGLNILIQNVKSLLKDNNSTTSVSAG